MQTSDPLGTDLEALQTALDTYGADRTRWPAPLRLRFASLIASNADAQRRLAEADAFGRLLDLASPSEDESADKVRAAVFAHLKGHGVPVVAPVAGVVVPMARRASPPASRSLWREASLLAASLMLGVIAGLSGTLDPAQQAIAGITSSNADADPDIGDVALGIDGGAVAEEESL